MRARRPDYVERAAAAEHEAAGSCSLPEEFDRVFELIGEGVAVQTVRATVNRLLSRVSSNCRPPAVLLQGETGTGKGIVAHALHKFGPRASHSFIAVNCGAIPETLLEAELLGFERGAFTDARQGKPGLFQAAREGVIFLDEIGLLRWSAQAKLLKIVEDRMVRPLGGTQNLPVDVWIITASNEDLRLAIREGRFRADLYYRLAQVTIELPALRERGDDIRLLAEHFLAEACADYGLPPRSLSADAVAALCAYPWPGNVRELTNVMTRVAALSEEQEITAQALDLPVAVTPIVRNHTPAVLTQAHAVNGFERAMLIESLNATGWNISFAADRLGIPRNTLRYRMARHGLRAEGVIRRRPSSSRTKRASPSAETQL
jgi:DNA-binding NtrC family response regulator